MNASDSSGTATSGAQPGADPRPGDLEPAGDRWKLSFTRELAHPPEQVWRAVTEPAHLAAWFPQRVIGEWVAGAPLRFEAPAGEHPAFDGEVLACRPPSLLEFRWGTDVIRFEIVPHDGGCTFVLTDVFGELGQAARDAAGWHTCVDLLGHHLDGAAAPWAPRERWGEVHAGYVRKFGPDAATLGPPGPS
jgi:uncharacterized protein YndB with AHSA1/START domain